MAKLRRKDVLRRPQKNFLATLGRPHVVLNVTPRGHPRRDVLGMHSGRHFNHNPQNGFFWIFFIFLDSRYIRYYTAKVSQKPDTSCFGPIMVPNVSTKIGLLGDLIRKLCAGRDLVEYIQLYLF